MDIIESFAKITRFIAIFWAYSIVALLSWFVPRSFYAKKVDEEVVLITGAGSGLGRDIALEYAKLKSDLVLWDINEAGLKETKDLVEAQYTKTLKYGERDRICSVYVVDVSRRENIHKAADQVKIDLNKNENSKNDFPQERYVSVLVNNAGIYYGQYLYDLTDQQIDKIFDINIKAHFWTVRSFLPDMIKNKKGHVVEIASMGGIGGMYKQVDYCATKFATVGFEQSLSIELNHLGLGEHIKTTVVCPFFFNSNLFSNFNAKESSIMSSAYVAKEAVLTMRCNHAQVFLPKLAGYYLYLFRGFFSRGLLIEAAKFSLGGGVENIIGHGSKVPMQE